MLLLFGQRVEANGITGYADGQLRIFLRVFHGVQQHLTVHHVDVQVLTTFQVGFVVEVTIHQAGQVGFLGFHVFAQGVRHDGEGIGDTIFGVGERQLGNGSQ
ncbi:hypothetical protein D3C73_487830 [compost metagenome]